MGLDRYRRKRDFDRTPEPAGEGEAPREGPLLFVVQKHDASRLHYDFRLEWDGVLKSWAVPKGPSPVPGMRRLAVRTEDHPLAYGDFEGVIPEEEYGGGTVVVWDRGTWRPVEDPARGFETGRLAFRLEGEKLKGEWRLVRSESKDGGDETWLLLKKKDAQAAAPDDPPILESRPDSVLTGRTVEEVATDRDRLWDRRGERRSASGRSRPGPDPAALPGARRGRLPKEPAARLATLVAEPPRGDDWIHEIKLDGYRILARLEKDRVRLLSRNGKDWTARFRRVADAVRPLAADAALLDGEVVVLDDRGISRFQSLQNALSDPRAELRYFVFDLLHLDGRDLTRVPIEARKDALGSLLAASAPLDVVTYGDHVRGGGEAFYQEACASGVEGIVSKRLGSTYGAGRSREWLKTKCVLRQEFVVVGFSEPSGSRVGLGALLLGVQGDEDRLVYAGKVGTGFTDDDLRSLRSRLERMERKTSPLDDPPRGANARGVHWVTPRLVAEVAFTEWTSDGRIRHPSFQGRRLDKPAEEVVREVPAGVAGGGKARKAGKKGTKGARKAGKARKKEKKGTRKAGAGDPRAGEVAGVRISSPDKLLWPDAGVTKRDLAEYWARVGERALPLLAERPLTLVRCPGGIEGECFYQKHAHDSIPSEVPRVPIEEEDGTETYLMVDDLPAIVSLAQVGVLELHVWGSRAGELERPERIVFDLDPGPGVEWLRVGLAAVELRDRLEGRGLRSFLLATGGKGLHVVAPLVPEAGWDAAKAFARGMAEAMAAERPKEWTSKMPKKYRKGRIFVDYLRNDRNATAIGPWSPRAREGAPVALPLEWEELTDHESAPRWSLAEAAERAEAGDPWAGYERARRKNGALPEE